MYDRDRSGTDYHEIVRGQWNGEDYWSDSSLYISDSCLKETGLLCLLRDSIGEYDRYGVTEISERQWSLLMRKAEKAQGEALTAAREIDDWVREGEAHDPVITVIGI